MNTLEIGAIFGEHFSHVNHQLFSLFLFRAVVGSSPEIIRSSLLPFLTFAAEDLTQTVANLKIGRFSHVKGTITRGATSLNYVHMVLLPVLTSMFDHLSRNNFGSALLGK